MVVVLGFIANLDLCSFSGDMCDDNGYKGGRMTDFIDTNAYINKVALLLALAELPQEAGKREVLGVIYDMPTVKIWEK